MRAFGRVGVMRKRSTRAIYQPRASERVGCVLRYQARSLLLQLRWMEIAKAFCPPAAI